MHGNSSTAADKAERLRRWLLESWPEPEVPVRDVLRLAPIRALRESLAARAAVVMLEKHGRPVSLEPGTLVRGKARKEAGRIVQRGSDVV